MLFDFKLELEETPRSIPKHILYKLHTYRFYAIIATLSISLGFSVHLFVGIAFGMGSSALYYLYSIWIDITSISFSTYGLNFDLQDVINDLEGK